ncbi:MAG: OmpH family outer membrane protein [Myxococcales bacterium]|nr:OmpH family outer membrane protein [Myxococcales bacterium]
MRKLMTTRLIVTLLAAATLLAATPAFAAQNIAVVDLQRVLLSTKAGKAAKRKFEGMQKKKRKALKRRDNQLKKQEKALMQERRTIEQTLRSKGAKAATPALQQRAQIFQQKVQTFQKEVMLFQRTQQSALKELAKKEAQLLKPIEDKIKKHINAIAKAKGYSLVLSRVAVVFAVKAVDITGEVTKRMNGK